MKEPHIVRVAMTETCNVFANMPESTGDLLQLAPWLAELRQANVNHHIALIESAAAAGAKIVGLGELFAAPYFALGEIEGAIVQMWQTLAEDAATGPTVSKLREVARVNGVILVAPIYELDATLGRRFNTAVVIDETGEILGKYRKNHIPAGTNDQGTFSETLFYGPGDGDLDSSGPANVSNCERFPVFQTSMGRLGVAICYDRHFEGVMSTLARNGAQIVFSPAVTFGAHSRLMWDLEFPVDAARHRLFIAGSNRKGSEAPWHQEFFGASYVAGPNGRLPSIDAPNGLVMADIDLGELERAGTSGWDLQRDARPGIYD